MFSVKPGGRVPGGGRSYMSVDIKCLSIDSLFYHDPTPNDPLFIQSTPNDPLFSTFVSNFTHKLEFFFARFAHILRNLTILWQFQHKIANFGIKIEVCKLNDPQF